MSVSLRALRLPAIGLIFAMLISGVRADNWERFRGPNGTGVSNDKNIPIKFSAKENVRWKVSVSAGNGSPVVWGDRLFLHGSNEAATERYLACYDIADGKELWKKTIKGTPVKFRYDSSHASSTPTTDGEAVYVSFWNGKDIIIAAYDFKGKELWTRNLGEFVSQHGAGASPIIYKDLLIYSLDMDAYRDANKKTGPVSNPSILYAFDKKTGKTVWETPREAVRACYSAPFILDRGAGPELIVTSTTAITSYEPLTGKSNWYWTWSFAKGPLRTIAATVYTNDTLLAMSGDGSGERLMAAVALKGKGKDTQPEQTWSNSKQFPYVTCPLIKGEHVYFVNDLGVAGCFVSKTGKETWFERIPDAKFYASPLMINDNVYAASEQGIVYVFAAEPNGYRLVSQNAIGELIRATPAVANGTLYVRTKSHLYAIGSK